MPNNRVKTTKGLQGKMKKSVHPHSRRKLQLDRVHLREEKLAKQRKTRTQTMGNKVDRLLWFCFALDPDVTHFTEHSDLHQIALDYISRHDEAIEEEISARRAGRPKSKKQETLEIQKSREQLEYDGQGGFMMPNLMERTSVLNLRHWSEKCQGDPSFLPRLNLIRIYKDKPDEVTLEQKGAGSHLQIEDDLKKQAAVMEVDAGTSADAIAA